MENTGNTETGYTDKNTETGVEYEYRVSSRNEESQGEASEWVTADRMPESNVNLPATGAPTISGTVQVGEALTADTTGIADDDGLDNAAFTYQWIAAGADIAGATGSTYKLVEAHEGKTVKVRVSFTDDAGNGETLTSEATEEVAGNEESLIGVGRLPPGRRP